MQGVVTDAYAELIKELWSAKYTSVAPVKFRTALTGRATQFAGYMQHDSQELLACLLDFLHEDLNQSVRALSPTGAIQHGHEEQKVSDDGDGGGGDIGMPPAPGTVSRKASVSGTKDWESRLGNDDSVVSNTFQGQLRDRLICPNCGHENLTFSFVQYLTVPLPAVYTTLAIRVVPWIEPLAYV